MSLLFEIGMNVAVALAALPAHGDDGRPALEVDAELGLDGVAQLGALELRQQRAEVRAIVELVRRIAPQAGDGGEIVADRRQRFVAQEAGHHDMLERIDRERRLGEAREVDKAHGPGSEIARL